jgi:putative oxidoreductase
MTAAVGELVGGILLALGLLGPVGPAIMIGAMVVAMISVHWRNGLFAAVNGVELPLLYATGAFGIALAGFGPFSLDALLGLQSAWTPSRTWIVLAIGLLGGILNLLVRKQPNAPPM